MKYLFSFLAIALMVVASSCEKDNEVLELNEPTANFETTNPQSVFLKEDGASYPDCSQVDSGFCFDCSSGDCHVVDKGRDK